MARAQEPQTGLPPERIEFEHLGAQDGLASLVIYDIEQDDNGFLWFSTGNGVSRYDGYHFKNYLPDENDPHAIGRGPAVQMILDSRSRLWITTLHSGLYRYDSANDRFIAYRHDPSDPHSISSNNTHGITEDRRGTVWICTVDAGLNRFDEAGNRFIRYRHDPDNPNSLSGNKCFGLFADSRGYLWVDATGVSLNRYDVERDEWRHYLRGLPQAAWFAEDRMGHMWLTSPGSGVARYDPVADRFTRYFHDPKDPHSLSHTEAIDVLEDSRGTLWVTTWGGGLCAYDREKDRFNRYQHVPGDPHSLSSNDLWGMFEDRSGVLWIGTYGSGVNKYDRKKDRFAVMRPDPSDPTSLSYPIKSIFWDDQGVLWVGTLGGGLSRYDPATKRFTHHRSDPNDPTTISHDRVWKVASDSTGDLWVATEHGLNRYDRRADRFIRYLHDPNDSGSLAHNIVRTVAVDHSDTVWVGLQIPGVDRYDPERARFIHYSTGAVYNSVIYPDRHGGLWLGNGLGLRRYDADADEFLPLEGPSGASTLGFITVISEGGDGGLWIGKNAGLVHLDRDSGTVSVLTEAGLENEDIAGILADEAGKVWVSHARGLVAYDPRNGEAKSYPLGTFNRGAYAAGPRGELFFGGPDRLVHFFPARIVDNPHRPPIVLTSFKKSNQEAVLERPLSEMGELELSHRDRFFSFEFAALDFSDPARNQYRYMLEGFDESWIDLGNTGHSASYTNLDGGDYVFRVMGSNNDGVWNEEELVLDVRVHPPYWDTWWFRGLVALVLAGAVASIYTARVRSIEARQRDLKLQVAARTRELQGAIGQAEAANRAKSVLLATMSHELRTPLNSILGYAQILKRQIGYSGPLLKGLDVIHRSGDHLLTLINEVLDMAKIDAGRLEIHPAPFHLASFLREIIGIVEARAQTKALALTFEALSELPERVIGDERRLRQVLLNLLTNAVKATDEGYVTLTVAALHESKADGGETRVCLRFSVEDTGIGVEESQLDRIFEPFERVHDSARFVEGTGLGLPISQQIVALMGGELQVESRPGAGTTFWFDVELPVSEVAEDAPAGQRRAIEGYEGRRRKVLVVDDRAYNRMLLLEMLEPLGFEVTTARSGREAVELASSIRPDAILMDLVMPGVTGFEATREIREHTEGRAPLILAVSASPSEQIRQQSQAAGCDGFLSKPVQWEELLDMLASRLRLTWIFRQPQQAGPRSDASMVLPPARDLQRLHDLAKQGRVTEIHQCAVELRGRDAELLEFTDAVLHLADGFEMAHIISWTEQLMKDG